MSKAFTPPPNEVFDQNLNLVNFEKIEEIAKVGTPRMRHAAETILKIAKWVTSRTMIQLNNPSERQRRLDRITDAVSRAMQQEDVKEDICMDRIIEIMIKDDVRRKILRDPAACLEKMETWEQTKVRIAYLIEEQEIVTLKRLGIRDNVTVLMQTSGMIQQLFAIFPHTNGEIPFEGIHYIDTLWVNEGGTGQSQMFPKPLSKDVTKLQHDARIVLHEFPEGRHLPAKLPANVIIGKTLLMIAEELKKLNIGFAILLKNKTVFSEEWRWSLKHEK